MSVSEPHSIAHGLEARVGHTFCNRRAADMAGLWEPGTALARRREKRLKGDGQTRWADLKDDGKRVKRNLQEQVGGCSGQLCDALVPAGWIAAWRQVLGRLETESV